MDINAIYDTLTGNVEISKVFDTSNHMPPIVPFDIELELLMGPKYVTQVPDGYPADKGEQMGFRSLHRAAEASYDDHALRVGTTELHIRDRNNDHSLSSILMLYTGGTDDVEIAGIAGKQTNRPSFVCMLENEVISTGILFSREIAIIQSWYPEGMEKYGGRPYAQTPDEFRQVMLGMLEMAGVSWVVEFNFVSSLYFLAKETIEQANTV